MVRIESIATEMGCTSYVRFPLESDRTAEKAGLAAIGVSTHAAYVSASGVPRQRRASKRVDARPGKPFRHTLAMDRSRRCGRRRGCGVILVSSVAQRATMPFDAQCVDAERSRTEGCDLEQTACYGDVLEEMDHLVLIGEVVMKEYCRREREHGHAGGDERRPVADREKQAASDLYYDGDEITGDRQRQAGRSDVGLGDCGRCDFAKTAQNKNGCYHEAAESRGVVAGHVTLH